MTPPSSITSVTPKGGNLRIRRVWNSVMLILLLLGSIIVISPLIAVLGAVFVNGLPTINLAFLTQDFRPVAEGGGGLLHAIVGTLLMNLLALLIGGLLGFTGGVLLSEYPDHPINPYLRNISDLLNSLPALLKGLVIYAIVVLPTGMFSGYAGALALAIILAPIVLRATEGVLQLVPWSVREAGLALGLPRWRVTISLVIPAATFGVVTGLMLGFARAAGEAAPLFFTAGGSQFLNLTLGQPTESLALTIFKYANEPAILRQEQAWGAALILTFMVLIASLLARWATRKYN